MDGNVRTEEESEEKPRAQPGTRRKLQEGEGKSQVSGGWGWAGNALPIGTQGWPGGRGEEGAPASAKQGWEIGRAHV